MYFFIATALDFLSLQKIESYFIAAIIVPPGCDGFCLKQLFAFTMATVPFGGRCFDALRPIKKANFNAFQKRKRQNKNKTSTYKHVPVAPEPVRHYTLMTIEQYEPYAALGPELQLYGPAPKSVTLCGCGRYWIDGKCLCANSHLESFRWAKENPELYKNNQEEEKRWKRVCDEWYRQRKVISDKWYSMANRIICEFERLQDNESPIECHSCESAGYSYCKCCCDNCNSKWCGGRCMDDEDCYYGYDGYGGYESEEGCHCGYRGCDATCGTLSCGCIDVCRGRCGRDDYF